MFQPTTDDGYPSHTSEEQQHTERIIASHLTSSTANIALNRNAHLNYLARNLFQGFPARWTVQDASQPWFMFWTLQSFSVLGAGLDPNNKQKAIDTVLAAQHPDGGFGGGPHQAPHLLPTYAAVCSLAIVGRPGSGGGWDQINRKGIYRFFMSLKQPDGSFRVARDAEVDIRGTYCLLAVAALLNLFTPALARGIPGAVKACQTYEGGFASASQPYYSADPEPQVLPSPRPPLGEAHGGYTYCALTSWALLQPFLEQGAGINVKSVLRWLAKMQGGQMDIGGFRGRTNKLVDGCYSWWVGGCFALLEALGAGAESSPTAHPSDAMDVDWEDVQDDLFSRKALQEYILVAAQSPSGGLRDKPPKSSDAYHTLYNLAGLSAAQHRMYPSPALRAKLEQTWVPQTQDELSLDDSETPARRDARRKGVFVAAQSWVEDETQGRSRFLGGKNNRVNATHPLFNLTLTHSRGMLDYFYGQPQTSS